MFVGLKLSLLITYALYHNVSPRKYPVLSICIYTLSCICGLLHKICPKESNLSCFSAEAYSEDILGSPDMHICENSIYGSMCLHTCTFELSAQKMTNNEKNSNTISRFIE